MVGWPDWPLRFGLNPHPEQGGGQGPLCPWGCLLKGHGPAGLLVARVG